MFSINRTFIPLLLNGANSVLKNGGIDEYTAYVLHSDLKAEGMDAIQSALGKRMKFHFIPVPVSLFEGFPTSRRYPQQIYYQLSAPLLPSELERILYLDVDTIIINSLAELADMPFEGTYFMACTYVRKALAKINQTRIGMEQGVPYINSGVMLLNLPLFREHLDLAEISAFANKKKRILFLPDQDILTALYGSLGVFYQELAEHPNSGLERNFIPRSDRRRPGVVWPAAICALRRRFRYQHAPAGYIQLTIPNKLRRVYTSALLATTISAHK